MKEELVKRERSIWVPFLIGSAVGAGVALLLAPKSGKELRKDIKDIAGSTRDRISTTVEKGREIYDESLTAVKDAVEAGKMAYIQEREKHLKAA
ncbi:MAG: YtxH domain-containing protein [Nitrospirota bacterium]|nr:YtxH domain-containing protein [Nitrospirota bacterium]